MSLNIDGSDLTDAVGGGGGGASPSDPAQDAKILVLENKTQNIDQNLTDGTKTEFTNKIVANEMNTPLSTATKFRSSQYYDNTGNSGFFMGSGANGTIQMNKTPYQGTANAIMSLSSNGTIQKSGAIVDASSNITTVGYVQAPFLSATTAVTTDLISNQDATPTPAIGIAPTTSDLTLRSSTYQGTQDAIVTLSTTGNIQKTGSTCDASGNLTAIKFRSNQYFDNTGNSGFFMGSGANGTIQMNKTPYQGTADAIMTLSSNGTIQKTGSTCDASGNLTAIKFRSNQYYDNTGNSGFFMGSGANGTIQMNKTPYQGTADAIMSLSANGTIQKSGAVCDGSGVITNSGLIPSSATVDIGDTNNRFRDIYYSGNLNGPTAPPTEFGYDLTFSDLLGTGALRDEWFSTSTSSKVFINKISTETVADLFITYTRSNPSLTEIKLDGTTTGTTTTQKYVDFRDSGGLPNNYGANELYNITFDAGVGNTWEMKTITCNFEHSGSGSMYDRLGLQASSDGVTYQNVSLSNFYQSATTTPPWSTTRTSTTDGYIFPVDQTNIANVTYNINSRFVKFYFTSDNSSQRAGWDVRMTASDAFHGSLLIKDVNTYNNTKYVIKGGAIAQNNGNDLEIKYESTPTSPLDLNFSGSIPLVNFTLPSVGWTETSRNNSQLSLSGDLSVSSLLVNGQPVTSGLSGISSQDNGGGDIEITFSGTDYKQAGYLTTDANGRIQVTPSIVVSNAEYDAIALKWTQERTNNNLQLVKIYLPQGVPVGQFNHTIHNVYILSIDPSTSSRQLLDVRFIGYQGSTSIQELTLTNVLNSTEIYNNASTAHPNNIPNANEKQHIINHFTSDYNFTQYPNFTITTVVRIAVLSGDVGNWNETKPFWVTYGSNGGAPPSTGYTTYLYGSQNGYSSLLSGTSPPSGYTEIF